MPHGIKKAAEKRNRQHEHHSERGHYKLLDRLTGPVLERVHGSVVGNPRNDDKTDREQHTDVVEEHHVRHLVHDPVQDHKGDHEQDLHRAQKKQRPGRRSLRKPGNRHIRIDQKGDKQQALDDLHRAAQTSLMHRKSQIRQKRKKGQNACIHIF